MLVYIVFNIMQRKMGITIVLTHTAQQQSITHQNCRNLKDQNSKYMNNSSSSSFKFVIAKIKNVKQTRVQFSENSIEPP